MESRYQSTSEELKPLLKHGEITYDLLWALFTPNDMLLTECPGTGQLRGVRGDAGEYVEQRGVSKFQVEARHFDFDGERLGEVSARYTVARFAGRKRIRDLTIFPLKHHPHSKEIEERLIRNGRRFTQLQDVHYQHYHGTAFRYVQGELVKHDVRGRIMVDAKLFREMNPNHWRPKIDSGMMEPGYVDLGNLASEGTGAVTGINRDAASLRESELMCCSATVYGFSLEGKLWCKYASVHSELSRLLTMLRTSGVRRGRNRGRGVAAVRVRRARAPTGDQRRGDDTRRGAHRTLGDRARGRLRGRKGARSQHPFAVSDPGSVGGYDGRMAHDEIVVRPAWARR